VEWDPWTRPAPDQPRWFRVGRCGCGRCVSGATPHLPVRLSREARNFLARSGCKLRETLWPPDDRERLANARGRREPRWRSPGSGQVATAAPTARWLQTDLDIERGPR
jgi:hypothetical protein